MDKADREKLKEAAQRATPGPWAHDLNGYIATFIDSEWERTIVKVPRYRYDRSDSSDLHNANYVALANPAAVLSLIEEIERLESEIQK